MNIISVYNNKVIWEVPDVFTRLQQSEPDYLAEQMINVNRGSYGHYNRFNML